MPSQFLTLIIKNTEEEDLDKQDEGFVMGEGIKER